MSHSAVARPASADRSGLLPSAPTMRGFDDEDFREVGQIIVEALGDGPDLSGLADRAAALCDKRPLYPGFRGYTSYVA